MASARQVIVHTLMPNQIHQLYSDHGWYLGYVNSEGRIIRCSDLFVSEDAVVRVLQTLRDLGIQDQDFLAADSTEHYLDVGVTSVYRPRLDDLRGVFLKPAALIRVMKAERARLLHDLNLPLVGVMIRVVRWCRACWTSSNGRQVVVAM